MARRVASSGGRPRGVCQAAGPGGATGVCRSRTCDVGCDRARYEEFGVPFGAPNGERAPERATVENANLLRQKRLAEYAVGESNGEPTDEEFMKAGFGETP